MLIRLFGLGVCGISTSQVSPESRNRSPKRPELKLKLHTRSSNHRDSGHTNKSHVRWLLALLFDLLINDLYVAYTIKRRGGDITYML